jgi:hypothetical protein
MTNSVSVSPAVVVPAATETAVELILTACVFAEHNGYG